MITVNPVKFNSTRPISFGQGNMNNLTAGMGILAVQSDSSKVQFEKDNFRKNLELTREADAVQNHNPISMLKAKARKTLNILFNQTNQKNTNDNFSFVPYNA